jgi:hypothetical protein
MRHAILFICLAMAAWLTTPAQQPFPRAVGAADGDKPASNVQIVGSPLLFSDYIPAKVESHNPLFTNDSLLFNFDKQKQVLLATTDKKKAVRIDRKEFQSVTFSLAGSSYVLKHVPAINNRDLFLALVEDSGRYCLYKFTYSTIRGRGYVEWYTYYLVFPFPDMRVVKLQKWDKKMLRHEFVLSSDSAKVDAFYSQQDELDAGEEFLSGLVRYLDQ